MTSFLQTIHWCYIDWCDVDGFFVFYYNCTYTKVVYIGPINKITSLIINLKPKKNIN